MDSYPTGKIREIVVLNKMTDGFRIQVGKSYSVGSGKRAVVTKIVRDENSYVLHGVLRYTVLVLKDGSEYEEPWRHYENASLEIICDVSD